MENFVAPNHALNASLITGRALAALLTPKYGTVTLYGNEQKGGADTAFLVPDKPGIVDDDPQVDVSRNLQDIGIGEDFPINLVFKVPAVADAFNVAMTIQEIRNDAAMGVRRLGDNIATAGGRPNGTELAADAQFVDAASAAFPRLAVD